MGSSLGKTLSLAEAGLETVTGFHNQIEEIMEACESGDISHQTVVDKIIGEQIDDNHRVVARKLMSECFWTTSGGEQFQNSFLLVHCIIG